MASTDTKTKNNKRKKSSLLMCFKPVAMDNSFKPKRQKDKTSDKCFAVEEKEDRWQALRAVLNETPLMKKVISRKKSNKDYSSRSNSNLKEEEASGKISDSQSKSIQGTDSNISSSFGSSSAFTSSSLTSSNYSSRTDQTSGASTNESVIEVPNDQKQLYGVVEDRKKKRYYGSMCMFFISLLVLIMWGKLFATLYTSIWFYLMPPRRVRVCNEGDISGESEFDSVEYYKKVIVE